MLHIIVSMMSLLPGEPMRMHKRPVIYSTLNNRSPYAIRKSSLLNGIVSQDFGTLLRFHWIDLKVVIGPDQVYFSFY
jgi:hypothetical protein